MPSMPLLNIIIAMIFIFLLLSLICSALKELVEGMLKKRGRNLRLGIETLLGKEWADKLYAHGLIQGLYRKGTNPAYIPAKTFSTALVALTSGGVTLPVPLQQALDAIEKQVGEDAAKMEAGIEDWYNASMDRVSGWYKRHTQIWLFFLAVLVTLAMNVDAVQVAQALSANPQLAAQIADTAGKNADQNRTSTATSGTSTTPATTPTSTTTPPPSPAVSTTTPAGTTNDTGDAKKKLDEDTKNLNSLGIPIGWDGKDDSRKAPWDVKDCWGQVWYLLRHHWAGWLVTMIAISFGAPFWFDMLNRFMVVRSTVKPAEKSPTEGAKS